MASLGRDSTIPTAYLCLGTESDKRKYVKYQNPLNKPLWHGLGHAIVIVFSAMAPFDRLGWAFKPDSRINGFRGEYRVKLGTESGIEGGQSGITLDRDMTGLIRLGLVGVNWDWLRSVLHERGWICVSTLLTGILWSDTMQPIDIFTFNHQLILTGTGKL